MCLVYPLAQCLWIVHSWLSHQFSLMFIRPVSCVPISPMSLDSSFLIVPSVFPNVYSSCVPISQCLWIVHSWLSHQFSLMFIRHVSCVPISQCLWIVHSWLYLQFSLTFILPVSCVPISQYLWIGHSWLSLQFSLTFILPVSFVPISPMSLDCSFLIVPSVSSNVYSSCVLCTSLAQCLWIVHSWLSLQFSLTFILPVSCVHH